MSALTGRRHRPEPAPIGARKTHFTQPELRTRRRAGLPVTYDGTFDLTAEVDAIVTPLATRITSLTRTHNAERGLPKMFQHLVADLVDALHGEMIAGIVAWIAERSARERIDKVGGHLDSASRAAALRHVADLHPRPPAPEIAPEHFASGQWATTLVDLVRPYSAPLADLLHRAKPPNDPTLRGAVSRSERLCDLLLEVDSAARQVEIRIDRAEQSRPSRTLAPNDRAAQARAELQKLGIEVEVE